jgi:hypothetical protein
VNRVTPDDPVRTSTEVVPVKTIVSPERSVLPAWLRRGSTTPSTQTLSQALPPWIVTTRLTPL